MTDQTEPDTAPYRDPLTTDDGLLAAAESMPTTGTDGGAISQDGIADRELQDTPGLDVEDDGTDPAADLARPGNDEDQGA